MNNKLALLVISCDKYSDLWHNFFILRDQYWSDCDFDWYLLTESERFEYPNVKVINTGVGLNWTGRVKYAISQINTPYIGWYLDDFYISNNIDNKLIHEIVEKMEANQIHYINVSDVFKNLIKMPEKHIYFEDHIFKIPKHKKYGISTAAAIWNKEFLNKLLGNNDVNAWQFEIELCKMAQSSKGLPGFILCDERMPFKVTPIPVVIQGRFYPKAIRAFKKKGICFNLEQREKMNKRDVLVYNFNSYVRESLRQYPILSYYIKLIAKKVFRIKFYTS